MKSIKLFACCIPVKGAKKSIICDIQRNTYKAIPNSMYEFLVKYEGYPIPVVKEKFPVEDHPTIDEYIDFLLNEEFGFLTENPEYYPKLEQRWESASKVANAVIDNNRFSAHDYKKIFDQLNDLRCMYLELRFFDACSIGKLEGILLLTENGMLRCIDIVLKFESNLIHERLKDLLARYKRINMIYIHSAPADLINELNIDDNLIYTSQTVENETHCGIINKLNFSANQNLFFESLSYNNCLNKKISIDSSGLIKNCPSMSASYGDMETTDLQSVIENAEFKKNWAISKDQIEICSDCEFRYICTDCRAYLKNENDPFSKPLKCSYNPYLAIWE